MADVKTLKYSHDLTVSPATRSVHYPNSLTHRVPTYRTKHNALPNCQVSKCGVTCLKLCYGAGNYTFGIPLGLWPVEKISMNF